METKGNNMKPKSFDHEQITVDGFTFDVYFNIYKERDPYGTGDSPSQYFIDLHEISLADSNTDIMELLSNSIIDEIETTIIDIYGDQL